MSAADDDEPVTRGYLRRELAGMMTGIAAEMARQANIIVEQIGNKIGVVDEKYADLPRRVARIETRMDAHDSDFVLHNRPSAPRRATKPKKRPR